MGHLTLTTSIRRQSVTPGIILHIFYLYVKFDNYLQSSKKCLWLQKFEIDHMTLITPLLGVACHPYDRT